MNKLDFVFAGPQRTASSWLREVLVQHPEIQLPEYVKETHTFSASNGKEGQRTLPFEKDPKRIGGEFAPLYFADHFAIQQLKGHNPHCKIIIGVREPVEKTISLFQHLYATGRVKKDFYKAFYHYPNLLFSGHYSFWIPFWEATFGKDNIYLFNYQRLKTEPKAVIKEIQQFLEVSHQDININAEKKVGSAEISRSPLIYKILINSAHKLRDNGIHWLPNLGKKFRIKNFLAKKGKLEIENLLIEELKTIFKEDREFLDAKGIAIYPFEQSVADATESN